ncbi:unnamed protein product [marine sediment metagenome]|uniref:Uncharacterized protein n=1 Tax=marine sediment metagenome TaxID=412755 RepID=X1IY10_9ZZZZ
MFCPFLKDQCHSGCPFLDNQQCSWAEYYKSANKANQAILQMMRNSLSTLKALSNLPDEIKVNLPPDLIKQVEDLLNQAGF